MCYFDNKYLQQYLDSGQELWVYDGYEWHEIVDMSDIEKSNKGTGYDAQGKASSFSYFDIQQIKVGKNLIITLDQLQKMMGSDVETEKPKKEPSSKKPEKEPDEEPPAKPEKEPDLSWYSPIYNVGRDLIREWRNQNDKRNS